MHGCSRGFGRISAVLLLIALSAAVLMPAGAQGEGPTLVQVIYIDEYEKEVRAGGSISYQWTLRNIDASDTVIVDVHGSISGSGWTMDATPATLTLNPGQLGSVVAMVTAPLERGSSTSNLTMEFDMYVSGYLVQKESTYANTGLFGAFASADLVLGYFDNPLPAPLDNEWGVFILDLIIWLAIAFIVAYLMDAVAAIATRKTTTMIDNIVLRILRTPVLLLIFAFGVVQSLDALHEHIPGDARSMILSTYSIIVVLVVFYLAYKLFKEILIYYGKIVAKRTASRIDDVLIPVMEKLGVVVIGLAALGYVLGVLDIDLTMFVAGGVVVSMVLAFAAQETISNFFSGMFLLLDRPFAEGDMIILSDGDWCEVRRIGLRTTRLYRYTDAAMISIPNNTLVNEKIARMTNVKDPGRVNVDVGVAYGTDPTKARNAIRKAIEKTPDTLLTDPSREPLILFDSMGDNALLFKVIVWLTDRSKRIVARDRLVEEIYRTLTEEGIEIPFPQRVVWLRTEEGQEQPKESEGSSNKKGGK